MAECKPLIAAIRSEGEGLRQAMRTMFEDEGFRKSAWYVYRNCSTLRRILEWDDFFDEAILRFVEAVIKGSQVKSCKAFFFGICRNYCFELTRRLREPEEMPPEEPPVNEGLIKQLLACIEAMGGQCELLLKMIYFYLPPFDPKDRKAIVTELRKYGYTLKESSVSATITNCKAKLRRTCDIDLEDNEIA